ncbi:VOC family protein [Humibacillus sp. DSM 29435]|uniref:VOC family protein n=1 Tax=Humibacillus sp. DSM 29435 TaxID=1869167 RepID=UPI00111306C7|nr:VOC family protein [Humibacillus sp. DSM 29435]
MPTITGFDHVALTVADLSVSVPFYTALWGLPPVASMNDGSFRRQVIALPGGTNLGLTEHDRAGAGFDPTAAGLDHIGFAVADRDELATWVRHLDGLGIEHSGPVEADYGVAVSFTDPDGVALELFVGRRAT